MRKTKKMSIAAFTFLMAGALVGNGALAAFTPGGATGSVNPGSGFPNWYKDQNGISLDLMEASDSFGISAPVEAGNDFSGQIGFGAEGFWWSAGAEIGTQARLTLALEAAFAGETAVDGEQSSFGRIRYRIGSLTPGETYIIKHPFGTVTEIADVDGEINVTDDIGCFAINGAASCDPADPLGSPLPQFNFSAALSSNIGPFLKWNTYGDTSFPVTPTNPLGVDPDLINPANPARTYIGNPAIDHAVTGSPINQNIFRVEGPGLPSGFIETSLFSVTGRLAEAAAPVIDAIPNQTVQVGNPISVTANATDANLDSITFSLTAVSGIGNEASAGIDPSTGVFSWTPDTAGTATFTVSASDGGAPVTTPLTIVVTDTAPAVASISVTPATPTIIAGATRQLTAIALDANEAQITPTPIMNWTSNNEAVATVNASGLVSGIVQGGPVTITASDGIVSGAAQVTVTSPSQIGGGLQAAIPVEANTGFPKSYKDRNGLALDLMEAADARGISAPVETGNDFSQQIGFGAEGFWASADASIDVAGRKPAILVQAVEAAFAGESAVSGEQSAFGRVRVRIDVTDPGTYTVTYPYGQKIYTIAAGDIGPGYEINDTNDIGCFAINGVSSCDPASPLGSTQAQFNFNAVGLSEIGPFLSWDTFSADPALTDAALIDNLTGRRYVGSAVTNHAIKGSPTGNNFFRVAGPNVGGSGINLIETDLFAVSGRLADTENPVITLIGTTPTEVVQNSPYIDAGATAIDAMDGDITVRIVTSNPVDTATVGTYTVTYSVTDTAGNSAAATRTVNVVAAPTDPAPTTVNLTSAASVIPVGATQQLSAVTLDQNGDVMLPAPAINFTSDNALVASVNQNGIVTGLSAGIANISGSTDGATVGSVEISVVAPTADPQITSVNLSSAVLNIPVGFTQEISVAAIDQLGVAIFPAPAIVLTSSNPEVAAIGSITGVSPGTATITASFGALSTEILVTITAPQAGGDTTAPVITLNGTTPVEIVQGSVYNDAGATATDDVDGDLTASIIETESVNTALVGSYSVTYNVSDATGNAAITVTRTVNVVAASPPSDTTPPVITISGSNPVEVVQSSAYSDAGATATDNIDPAVTVTTTGTVNTDVIGQYTITYNATDVAGNPAIPITRTVNVVTAPPGDPTGTFTIDKISVTNLTDNSARINWTTSSATTGKVIFGTQTKKDKKTRITTIFRGKTADDSVTGTTHSVKLTGLKKNQKYFFNIEAANTSDSASSSIQSFKTLKKTPTIAVGSTDLPSMTVSNITSSLATVFWTTAVDSIGSVGLSTNSSKLKIVASDNNVGKEHSVNLSGLKRNTKYYYNVVIQKNDGSDELFSATLSFKTTK